MTKVEVTCCLGDRSRVESRSHVDCRYDIVTAMTQTISNLTIYLTTFAYRSLSSSMLQPVPVGLSEME